MEVQDRRRRGISRGRWALVVNPAALALSVAEGGIGLAYLVSRHVKQALEDGRLECILDGYCPPSPGFHIYYPSRAQVLPKLRAFIDLFRRTAS